MCGRTNSQRSSGNWNFQIGPAGPGIQPGPSPRRGGPIGRPTLAIGRVVAVEQREIGVDALREMFDRLLLGTRGASAGGSTAIAISPTMSNAASTGALLAPMRQNAPAISTTSSSVAMIVR